MCEVLDPHRAGVRVTATEGEILIDTVKARAGLPLGPQHPTLLGSSQAPAAECCLVKEGTPQVLGETTLPFSLGQYV